MVNPQRISTYLRKPYELDAEAENNLREVINKYPYFNNAWLLLARSLHNQNSPKFDENLKQASMYAGDRSLLYKLVNVEASDAGDEIPKYTQQYVPASLPTAEDVAPAAIEAPIAEPNEIDTEQDFAAMPTIAADYEPQAIEEEVVETPPPVEVPAEEEEKQETTEEPILATAPNEVTGNTSPPIPETEEDKVISAYEEIFGSPTSPPENIVSQEFETPFAVDDEEENVFGLLDDEDFVLHVEESNTVEVMVDEIVAEEKGTEIEETLEEPVLAETELETPEVEAEKPADEPIEEETTSEEAFEIAVGEHLDADNDGVIAPPPSTATQEETFELETIEAIAESQTEQPIEKVAQENAPETVEGATEPTNDEANYYGQESMAQPIAFKLGKAENTSNREEAPQEQKSVLVSTDTFYEWLAQLKNTEGNTSEKKNSIAKEPQPTQTIENTVAETTPAPSKSNVDAIIERFISINPSISRPKAEFYNPATKSKESDTESDDLATETLAKIYHQQNLNDKAIDIYQRLIVLHPHKTAEYKAIIATIAAE